MALLGLLKDKQDEELVEPVAGLSDLTNGYSIEVTPRTAAKISDFKTLLPRGTRVYIAHVEGTSIAEMAETAKRLSIDGFPVMPHFPARMIPNVATLEDWIKRYRGEAGVDQALLLGGGLRKPVGNLESSMQFIESGLFDRHGFKRLHVAGHPEGNRDIDADGGYRIVDEALKFKQAYCERSDAEMAIVTQFAFDARPIIAWAERIAAFGVKLPIHLGVAGPTKLQTLIKFAIACGVGPSLSVLQKRARDFSKLLVPYEPVEILRDIAAYKAAHPESLIQQIHLFPLGGIGASAAWMSEQQRSVSVA